ncbi:MAG: copper resistance protein B, partial [Sphingopyxis sp.]
MTRAVFFLAGTSALAFASPAAAQSMDHSSKPGMEMGQADTGAPACAPEHAAMGHCTAEPGTSKPGMTMDKPAAAPVDPDCLPEHAKMGHCTPKAGAAVEPPVGASGTDLAPGDATAPPPPGDWYADRVYPAAEMEHSRHEMMKENGAQTIAFISFN